MIFRQHPIADLINIIDGSDLYYPVKLESFTIATE